MELPQFEIYAPVRNTINKALGVVVKVAADNITIQPQAGDRMTFRAQYLAPATAAEAEALQPLINRLRQEEADRLKPKAPPDPAVIRAEFDKFLHHIAVRYPVQAKTFGDFWAGVVQAAGDAPGITWEMKPNSAKTPGPVLKVFNTASQKYVYCLAFLAGRDLRMEIKKEFLPPGCEPLFPIDHAMFGAGRAVELTYNKFTPDKQHPYLDCIKLIYQKINQPAG
ncbi:MAG TPA: hypothetical protein PKI19_12650 [Elusimicrobiales bacterium]|nr:hypothetical protein [Elusimicrobiales bacterium]